MGVITVLLNGAICSTALSAKGAKCKSLGHRPVKSVVTALKTRNIPGGKKLRERSSVVATAYNLRLQRFAIDLICPGAALQALTFRALGAQLLC